MGRGDLNVGNPADFGDVLYPNEAQEPILARPVRGALLEWLTEIWAKEELKAVGLRPRQKALFTGPPGVGKTTLAHHLAARLGLPLLCVRSDRLIDAYIGATARNTGALFDTISSKSDPYILFMDEFDSLGGKRRQARQGADEERNSSVNSLLARMERFNGMLIAATNRGEDLDEAIWRRFDLQINVALPGQDERELILERYLAPYRLPPAAVAELARGCSGASPALMRQFCEGLKRQLIIGPKVKWDMERERVIARLVASLVPHPDIERPRLWQLAGDDPSVALLEPWPLASETPRKKARAA